VGGQKDIGTTSSPPPISLGLSSLGEGTSVLGMGAYWIPDLLTELLLLKTGFPHFFLDPVFILPHLGRDNMLRFFSEASDGWKSL
jgi:hypothetical protein